MRTAREALEAEKAAALKAAREEADVAVQDLDPETPAAMALSAERRAELATAVGGGPFGERTARQRQSGGSSRVAVNNEA